MPDLFITKIHINKVRHLENIDICLSENEKKHLILTGKNGSGKTSVLSTMFQVFNPTSELLWSGDRADYINWGRDMQGLNVLFSKKVDSAPYKEVEDVYLFVSADRTLNIELPKSIEAVNLSELKNPNESASKDFVKYILHLHYQKVDAIANNNHVEAEAIEKWFNNFTNALRKIYDCPELELKHNSKELSFKIAIPDREPFGFNEMADGYSSFLNIVMELMMRMENKASMTYDLPGIVLIDEIETHLHVELQKKVLPFLTKMFPRIQFIVTTHSPFVITSISNAIVFDLEKQEALEDLSAYSYEGIIESYFETDMYSKKAKEMFEQYKNLVDKPNRTIEDSKLLTDAIDYLEQVSPNSAKELVYAFRDMEAKRGAGKFGQAQ